MLFRLLFITVFAAVTALAQVPAIEPGVSHDLAKWRAARYSDVRYKLNLTLVKMSPVLKGTMEIRVKVLTVSPDGSPPYEGGVDAALGGRSGSLLILDWRKIKGSEQLSTISAVTVNGRVAENHPVGETPPPLLRKEGSPEAPVAFTEQNEHLIFRDGVVAGENVIKLDFTSPILTSGSAITRYVDKEDGAEYIYSLFVPSDASTAFPVFDQPDLKARFTVCPMIPNDWKFISNSDAGTFMTGHGPLCVTEETKPISTYVFAFAAGQFEQMSEPLTLVGGTNAIAKSTSGPTVQRPSNATSTPPAHAGGSDKTKPPTSIYVRKSQAAKFKPHAAEVFRLNREGIKYLETYFDYKFPFPKYDIVLIPEFPFGGMEHAGATFLREASVIFPQEPTKNDYISRANVIFHEAAHQWFGDTVTMKWFDDLWLKEGFAEFMAYKTLEKVMPEYNAWKVFYERNKQAAYLTDSTKGTTPIYQEIANLNSAKSAYGNIVYRKAPSFLKQAEFYLGPDKFQTAVRAFLKKHEYANAGWEDLVEEFGRAKYGNEIANVFKVAELQDWAKEWVTNRGLTRVWLSEIEDVFDESGRGHEGLLFAAVDKGASSFWRMKINTLSIDKKGGRKTSLVEFIRPDRMVFLETNNEERVLTFPNFQDYGYGIFLLDNKSRDYVLKNIQNEKDDFLRTMMWGSLWDSVREAELDPKDYVELVIKNLSSPPCLGGVPEGRGGSSGNSTLSAPCNENGSRRSTTPAAKPATPPNQGGEQDESTIATLLGRVSTAVRYYMPDDAARQTRLEALLIDRMQHAPTPGQRITYYRAFLGLASSDNARNALKQILAGPLKGNPKVTPTAPLDNDGLPTLRTKDKFDIVTRLMILGDADAPRLLAQLEKTETSDEARRYAYAARAGLAMPENKAKYWNDFVNNKDISESWIEAAFVPFNATSHADLTLPYLERALAELPSLKRGRKIFFINGWLGAFIGGQRSEAALAIINKFLADNPNLDKDLRLKILENSDLIERAVKIQGKFKNG